ncbi:FkbM family methyltransferase [Chryseobacterium sp. ISL-6]|uniref:FkbM family methyltransferase n=1 Tax=Chryseobacterium sp. ISL-6 TaxID=2819143 RepID=UPI001BE9102D|nr:FkbM family methyltransferase [Chryseobacterium sp. ISL-6]MBT2619725.1 FkbM family methyltransferase [Chryseobacterium sp. ISL-6]
MSLKNYISKVLFNKNMSGNLKTFLAFIVNSKRYSSKFKKSSLDFSNNEIFAYNFKNGNKRFDTYLRTFKGDIDIFYEIFWKETYKEHLQFLVNDPKIIVDLGAHIGMTSMYLSLKYPNSKIYSVEASQENFEILKTNTKSFTNIVCLNAAAHFEDGTLKFGGDELSYNQKVSEQGILTKALSMGSIMKSYDIEKIDLLKIDIEGAEIELLSKNNSWLQKVENIVIEIHPPYDAKSLNNDIEPYNFSIKNQRKDVLFVNKSLS